MATLHHHGIFQDSFIFLNMFENPVSIKLAFYRFSIPTKGSDISKANHELYRYTNDNVMLEFNVHYITGVIPLVLPVLPTEAVVNKKKCKNILSTVILSQSTAKSLVSSVERRIKFSVDVAISLRSIDLVDSTTITSVYIHVQMRSGGHVEM